MQPVLLHYNVPSWMNKAFGPTSQIFAYWQQIAIAFAVCFLVFMWVSGPPPIDPETGKPQEETRGTGLLWLSGLASLALGILLAGIGVVKLGKIQLHTYGVMVSAGFLVGIMLAIREGKRVNESPERILDLAFWVLIAAIVGSRVLHIVTEWPAYWADFQQVKRWQDWKLLRVWEGGLVFYGGLLGAIFAAWWFMTKNKMNFWKVADVAAPSIALGQVFGRLGCFSAGCCHGKAGLVPWSVTFTQGLAPRGIQLHPTQLYEALATLLIFVGLLWIRSRKRYHGQVLIWYMLTYSIARFTIEIFRGDPGRGYLFQYDLFTSIPKIEILSTSQFVSICLFVLGLIFMARRNKPQSA
ncbi:MAG: prolipoprotein diacylglyceryl transferase [Deltaproteobacteria bacterium]|nr:prolipoprotein diacylglyceryl transferase [Deltaproteobacteria bacterium]MBU48083.1 prolipoprotein diacylglyceryl transferase [Deltaproteobacteria bacterium]|tara:strand:- start:1686 stop:2747 length:1062 start_codon:yes stop_codon:yes gene_type:complete